MARQKTQARVDLSAIFQPYPQQARLLRTTSRYVLFLGGIAAGKTQSGAMWALKKAWEEPGVDGLVLGRTFQNDAIKLLHARINHLLGEMNNQSGINFIRKWDKQNAQLTLLNGSSMTFRGFERNVDALRGPEYGWAWIDELSQVGQTVDPTYVMDVVDGRLRGVAGKNKQLLVTMTARGLEPVATRFQTAQRRRDPLYYVVKATSYDNPYTPRADLDAWRSGMSARRVKQEIWCILLRPQGAVWPEFDRATHCIAVDRREYRNWPHVCGIDWGATRGNVALEIRVHPESRQWVVVDELVPQQADFPDGQMNRSRFRKLLKAWWTEKSRGYPDYVVSDRAITTENNWLRAVLRKYAPSCRFVTLVTREEQRRYNGVEMVRDALDPSEGRPRILFSEQLETRVLGETPGIIPSMTNLKWATDGAGRPMGYVRDTDPERDSTDALRYAWVGNRNIRELHITLPRYVGGDLEETHKEAA